jgi:hypothetical protein
MLKRMLVITISAFLATLALSGQPDKGADQKQQPASQSNQTVVLSAPAQQDNGEADKGKTTPNAPYWHTAFENPDGMLVVVGIITCAVIGWQSLETRKASKAFITQIQMTKAKERARLEIKGSSVGMGFLKRSDDSWVIKGNLQFRNTGISNAYIIDTGGGIAIADSDKWPLSVDGEAILDWPDSVIAPASSGLVSSMREHSATRDEFAVAVSSGKAVIYIQAFVEYESLGTIWHRDIGYVWVPKAAKTMYDKSPRTSEQKVTEGSWAGSPKLRNREYEARHPQNSN